MVYVISDIHGEYDLFMQLLRKISFSTADTLYVLGDVLDRGPRPFAVLKWMMAQDNVIPITGNHELMALPCLELFQQEITDELIDRLTVKDIENLDLWMNNGAETSINEFKALSIEDRRAVTDYLGEFSTYDEVDVRGRHYVLVHGGFPQFHPFDLEKPFSEYSLHDLVWTRPNFERPYSWDWVTIVGHTPTQLIPQNDEPGWIYRKNNIIDIDCGVHTVGGRLAAFCLETEEAVYVRNV